MEELEQLTRHMQHPREARQTQKRRNIPSREGQHNLDIPQGAEKAAESGRAQGHGPHLAPGGEGNEATPGGHVGREELHHPQQGAGEQSWEHRFKSLQQELNRVKEVVRGRAPDTMDTLVQQTEPRSSGRHPAKTIKLRRFISRRFQLHTRKGRISKV